MANLPTLSLLEIAQIESEFLMAFPYENRDLDNQVMLYQIIDYSFHNKLQWLADRDGIVDEARSYYKAKYNTK